MNKSELIKKLEKMPDDVPVWLGVDSGEGYSLLKDVFYGNSRHLPLDGDETST